MELNRRAFLAAAAVAVVAGCTPAGPEPSPTPTRGTPEEILARSAVPVLCFHQLREHAAEDSAYARSMITPPAAFSAQLQALRDAGYQTVSGAALAEHLEFGEPALPAKPVLLTFDDGSLGHYTVGLPVLREFGFVGTFFPMTVVLNKRNWLSHDNLREMDTAGMTIGAHTWDHQRLDRLPPDQWATQIDQPRAELGEILGHAVDLLAYPYGMWNQDVLPHVVQAGYRAAFQLSDAQDVAQPLLTIRRVMPPPTWDGATLLGHLESDF